MWRSEEQITNYIITQVIHGFRLVLAYDLLEDRRTIDVTISFYANKFVFCLLCFLLPFHAQWGKGAQYRT